MTLKRNKAANLQSSEGISLNFSCRQGEEPAHFTMVALASTPRLVSSSDEIRIEGLALPLADEKIRLDLCLDDQGRPRLEQIISTRDGTSRIKIADASSSEIQGLDQAIFADGMMKIVVWQDEQYGFAILPIETDQGPLYAYGSVMAADGAVTFTYEYDVLVGLLEPGDPFDEVKVVTMEMGTAQLRFFTRFFNREQETTGYDVQRIEINDTNPYFVTTYGSEGLVIEGRSLQESLDSRRIIISVRHHNSCDSVVLSLNGGIRYAATAPFRGGMQGCQPAAGAPRREDHHAQDRSLFLAVYGDHTTETGMLSGIGWPFLEND